MAKKNLKYYIPGAIALVFGIAAFCMMFLTAITYTGNNLGSKIEVSGMLLTFGGDLKISDLSSVMFPIKHFGFNFMMFLAFILPLIGGVLALVFKNGLITKIVTTACFVASAVFLFCAGAFSNIGLEEGIAEQLADGFYSVGLGAGTIVGGILSVLGAFVCFFKGTIAKAIK